MSEQHIKIIAVISVIVVCVAAIGYVAYYRPFRGLFVGEWHYSYEFSISFDTTEDLYNMTLYLPMLIEEEETSPILYNIIDRLSQQNLTTEIITTESGKMLKISADFLPNGSYGAGIRSTVDNITNAKKVVESKLNFYPRFNETYVGMYYPGGSSETKGRKLYNYTTYIYVNYNSSQNVTLTFSLRFHAFQWRALIFMAYEGNGYTDCIGYSLYDGGCGWHLVNGTLEKMG